MKLINRTQSIVKKAFFLTIILFSILTLKAQTQNYVGTSDGDNIKANISWGSNQSVSGSYFFTANPTRVYKLSGTNYVDGEIEITESFKGKRTGNGTLTKSMSKGRITWSGYITNVDGSKSYISLTRPR
jgi:hypothetical protein